MAVNRYDTLGGGAYRFHDDGAGRSMVGFGGEAARLKAMIDGAPDRRTAQFDPSAPFGSAASVPPAGPPAQAPSVSDVGPNMSAPPPQDTGPNMSVEPPAAPAPPAPEAPRGPDPTPGQAYAAAMLSQGRYVPGRAAVDPENLNANRRAVRVAQTVSGGLEETPEEKAERLEAERTRKRQNEADMADLNAANAEMTAAAEQRRTDAYNATLAADIERRDAENRRRKIDADYESKRASAQKELDAANEMKVDPDRFFREKGTASRVLSAIGVALGAYGASVNGGPNFALEIVNKSIDRDIDAQMDEIRRKGAAANNAVSELSRRYDLSVDEARELAKMAAHNYVAARADMTAAQMGTAEAKQKAVAMRLQLSQQMAQHEASLANLYKGRVTTQSQFMDPQRATGGGYRQFTPEEIKKYAEAGISLDKLAGVGGDEDGRLMGAKLNREQDRLARRVTMPDGSFAWATTKDRADKAQSQSEAATEYMRNLDAQVEILNKVGDSVTPELRGKYDALVQRNLALAKEVEVLGAITKSDQDLVRPLTGEGGQDVLAFKSKVLGSIGAAKEHVNFRFRQSQKQLFKEPEAQRLVSETEEGAGIKVGN